MARPKKNTTSLTFRLSLEEVEKLDAVCELSGLTRSIFFREVINAQYDKINGNPKLKEALEKLKLASDMFGNFSFLN